jgi:hypothetical protein
VIEIDGVPLREYLIAQAGLQKRVRVYEDGRRVQYSDTGFLSSSRVEVHRGMRGSVSCLAVPSAYTHVPRQIYGTRDESLLDKFMRRVEKCDDGHWRWTGHCSKQGYGRFSIKVDGKYKTVAAHRWFYEYMVRPLSPEETIDHLNDICGIRNCVNIDHLDPCSGGENARRARVKLSLADREVCNNGHVLSEVGTRVDARGVVLCNACSSEKATRSNRSYFKRRAIICDQLGLQFIVCEEGHRLDLDDALLKSGRCRECHRERAQRDRDRQKAVLEEVPKISAER